ncbi:hypothetical protein NUW54_g8207 [Trametes sanguinea]|uniref:Uncharacterized protein n=1 Tax=Trametes sanguinea TaxID=158606 RepID=A0ACC1PGY6_9APHY|nr:hypothetical protein NUW54_g8207 [Trametes sanguinea]
MPLCSRALPGSPRVMRLTTGSQRSPGRSVGIGSGSTSLDGPGLGGRLEPPQLVTYLQSTVEGSEDIFEGRNSEGDEPNEVIYVSGKQTQWLDYLQSPILALTATSTFCAVAMQDGTVTVYSHTGRRLLARQPLAHREAT